MIQPLFPTRTGRLAVAALALVAPIVSLPSIAADADGKRPAYASAGDGAFILFRNDKGSILKSGSTSPHDAAHRLRSGEDPLLYVRQDGASYVIRDTAVLSQAEDIVKPQMELGARQGELGSRQGALGVRQGELGRRQAMLALRDMSGRQPETAAREQAALAREQRELGDRQAVLGEEQAALGRQQERLAREAEAKLRALVDDALRRGLGRTIG